MSSKILGNVWDACAAHDIKGAKLVIMARLADYSNDDGVCYQRDVSQLQWYRTNNSRADYPQGFVPMG